MQNNYCSTVYCFDVYLVGLSRSMVKLTRAEVSKISSIEELHEAYLQATDPDLFEVCFLISYL